MAFPIITKDYSGAFSYSERPSAYVNQPGKLVLPPRLQSKSCLQKVQKLNKESLNFFEEERVLKTRDRRYRIETTTQYPQSVNVQISARFSGLTYSGSGAMVGPHHVLTCAHNVFCKDNKNWAEKIVVCPGRNNLSAPFGQAEVTRAHIFSKWSDEADSGYDIALLILNESIGKCTGWAGILCLENQGLLKKPVKITGYPGEKDEQLWGMKNNIKLLGSETIEYDIDTSPGQSGSPIWIENMGMPYIIGVHTLGSCNVNSGVRISNEKFINLIAKKIFETYKLDKSIPAPTLLSRGLVTRQASKSRPAQTLGAEAWAHLGDVGEEPPLPERIHEILSEPCPAALGLERFGKTIGDTHILVLIPATLDGKPLTLNRFKELLDQREGPKFTRWHPEGHENTPASSSYWALISKACIQNSRNKSYDFQRQMVEQLGDHYRLPKLIEMVFGLYLQEVTHHDNLYPNNLWTRCEDMSSDGGCPMAVRGFGGGGGVYGSNGVAYSYCVGVGVLRKSSF
ncbi:MAG: trypsin-like serine protease [Chlamydiales bacterium]|nr:trypsin-like serine protease [Chlamydiales bacterium]